MNKRSNFPRSDNFIKRRRSLNESAAMAALTLAAHRVLLRLEIELMQHGGKNNGKLICTFDNFVAFGIRRHAIARAIRLLVNVGLVEITLRGWRRAAHGRPARYRLTYLEAFGKPPTDEWKAYVSNQKRSQTASQNPKFSAGNVTTGCSAGNVTTSGVESITTWDPISRCRKRHYHLDIYP